MNGRWRFVVSDLVIEFLLRVRVADRRRVVALLARLTSDPSMQSGASARDRNGREISLVRAEGFEIAYWLDHFVKEVRVVEVRKI